MSWQVSRRRLLVGSALGSVTLSAPWSSITVGCVHTDRNVARANSPMQERVFGLRPGVARLSRNENPYGPSTKVLKAIEEAAKLSAYYADSEQLEHMIADKHGLSADHVVVSNGSVENLAAVSLAWSRRGKIVVPDLYWDEATDYAQAKGADVVRVPLTSGMHVDLKAIAAACDDQVALVHLCNPNNPTGLLLDPDELRDFCRQVPKTAAILIDEAYNELTDHPERNSMIDLVREGHNVLVSRTFSKIYGMAGLRVGYLLSTPQNIDLINDYKMCWVAAPSFAAALAAYEDETFLAQSKSKIIEARQWVTAAVQSAGLECLPSQTNFVYVKVPCHADVFQQQMLEQGVLIRGVYKKYTEWSRVSMGHLRDVERYVSALPRVLNNLHTATR